MIATSHGPLEVFPHQRAFSEDAREHESQNYDQPAAWGEARIEMKRVGGVRNRLADAADNETEELKSEQHPGDGLQTGGVRRDERITSAHRLGDRNQPPEDGVIEWNCDQAAAIARNPIIVARI